MSDLRPYQTAAVESALHALATAGSAIVQMPTGAGKTKAATAIVKSAAGPIWFVCHRREIIRQAAKAFSAAGIEFGIVSPEHPFQPNMAVQIVSVQTLVKRVADLPAPLLVIWDECHHVAAKSWAAIRNALTGAKHLGLTATPERLDGKGLAEWFAVLIKGPTVRTLIDDGYLVPFRYFAPSEPDLTSAKLQAGDYRKVDVEKAMNIPVLIGDAPSEYKKNLDGKRALVFASSVDASRLLAERFNAEGVPAMHVDGTTPSEVRDAAVERLASGDIKVLTNVEVFTEGVDIPAIDAVILLRPTKSPALFLQMVGRALRPAPGKTEAVIFDHAGLWLDHDLPSADFMWSLEGDAQKERLAAARADGGRKRRCPECKEVRVERVETCSCGYEFPTGREIGEYDGQLWELRRDNLILLSKLAPMAGFSESMAHYFIKYGAPHVKIGGYYYSTPSEFNGWIEANGHNPRPRLGEKYRKLPERLESMKGFARRLGISGWRIRKHLPDHLYEKSGQGNQYRKILRAETETWIRSLDPTDSGLFVLTQLCPDHNTRTSLVKYHGLETVLGGMCSLDSFESTMESKRKIAAGRTSTHETRAKFGRRVGYAQTTSVTKLARQGLPCASNGWVHIQQGLEWVRDNTKIKIPPEAWPSANDNGAQNQAAA